MSDPATCFICRLALHGETVNARGDVGEVHVACFTAWDAEAEVFERSLVAFQAGLPPAPDRRSRSTA